MTLFIRRFLAIGVIFCVSADPNLAASWSAAAPILTQADHSPQIFSEQALSAVPVGGIFKGTPSRVRYGLIKRFAASQSALPVLTFSLKKYPRLAKIMNLLFHDSRFKNLWSDAQVQFLEDTTQVTLVGRPKLSEDSVWQDLKRNNRTETFSLAWPRTQRILSSIAALASALKDYGVLPPAKVKGRKNFLRQLVIPKDGSAPKLLDPTQLGDGGSPEEADAFAAELLQDLADFLDSRRRFPVSVSQTIKDYFLEALRSKGFLVEPLAPAPAQLSIPVTKKLRIQNGPPRAATPRRDRPRWSEEIDLASSIEDDEIKASAWIKLAQGLYAVGDRQEAFKYADIARDQILNRLENETQKLSLLLDLSEMELDVHQNEQAQASLSRAYEILTAVPSSILTLKDRVKLASKLARLFMNSGGDELKAAAAWQMAARGIDELRQTGLTNDFRESYRLSAVYAAERARAGLHFEGTWPLEQPLNNILAIPNASERTMLLEYVAGLALELGYNDKAKAIEGQMSSLPSRKLILPLAKYYASLGNKFSTPIDDTAIDRQAMIEDLRPYRYMVEVWTRNLETRRDVLKISYDQAKAGQARAKKQYRSEEASQQRDLAMRLSDEEARESAAIIKLIMIQASERERGVLDLGRLIAQTPAEDPDHSAMVEELRHAADESDRLWNEAGQRIEQIHTFELQAELWSEMAMRYQELGLNAPAERSFSNVSLAIARLQKAKDRFRKDRALQALAIARAEGGQRAAARAVIERMSEGRVKDKTRRRVLDAFLKQTSTRQPRQNAKLTSDSPTVTPLSAVAPVVDEPTIAEVPEFNLLPLEPSSPSVTKSLQKRLRQKRSQPRGENPPFLWDDLLPVVVIIGLIPLLEWVAGHFGWPSAISGFVQTHGEAMRAAMISLLVVPKHRFSRRSAVAVQEQGRLFDDSDQLSKEALVHHEATLFFARHKDALSKMADQKMIDRLADAVRFISARDVFLRCITDQWSWSVPRLGAAIIAGGIIFVSLGSFGAALGMVAVAWMAASGLAALSDWQTTGTWMDKTTGIIFVPDSVDADLLRSYLWHEWDHWLYLKGYTAREYPGIGEVLRYFETIWDLNPAAPFSMDSNALLRRLYPETDETRLNNAFREGMEVMAQVLLLDDGSPAISETVRRILEHVDRPRRDDFGFFARSGAENYLLNIRLAGLAQQLAVTFPSTDSPVALSWRFNQGLLKQGHAFEAYKSLRKHPSLRAYLMRYRGRLGQGLKFEDVPENQETVSDSVVTPKWSLKQIVPLFTAYLSRIHSQFPRGLQISKLQSAA